eukprot:jgi/Orpsp1_1/1190164/evm.model.d7180000077117.1
MNIKNIRPEDKMISTCNITKAIRWKAPELLENYNISLINGDLNKYKNTVIGKISTYSDIFSLGRLYYEIIAHDNPFHEVSYNSEVENKVVSNQYPSRVEANNSKDEILCSDKMWDILVKTWDYDPYRRISLLSLASILLQLKSLKSNNKQNETEETESFELSNIQSETRSIESNSIQNETSNENKMKINFAHSSGTITFDDVKPTDKISDVKVRFLEKLANGKPNPKRIQFWLRHNGTNSKKERKLLDNKKTFSNYHIKSESTIVVLPNTPYYNLLK